jgi:hypothetical protein
MFFAALLHRFKWPENAIIRWMLLARCGGAANQLGASDSTNSRPGKVSAEMGDPQARFGRRMRIF